MIYLDSRATSPQKGQKMNSIMHARRKTTEYAGPGGRLAVIEVVSGEPSEGDTVRVGQATITTRRDPLCEPSYAGPGAYGPTAAGEAHRLAKAWCEQPQTTHRLRPIDVGFDLRETKHATRFGPMSMDRAVVECLDQQDSPILVIGDYYTVARKLRSLGYRVMEAR